MPSLLESQGGYGSLSSSFSGCPAEGCIPYPAVCCAVSPPTPQPQVSIRRPRVSCWYLRVLLDLMATAEDGGPLVECLLRI